MSSGVALSRTSWNPAKTGVDRTSRTNSPRSSYLSHLQNDYAIYRVFPTGFSISLEIYDRNVRSFRVWSCLLTSSLPFRALCAEEEFLGQSCPAVPRHEQREIGQTRTVRMRHSSINLTLGTFSVSRENTRFAEYVLYYVAKRMKNLYCEGKRENRRRSINPSDATKCYFSKGHFHVSLAPRLSAAHWIPLNINNFFSSLQELLYPMYLPCAVSAGRREMLLQ